MTISTAHRAARNAASIAMADAGPGPSSVKIYTEQGGVLLAVCRLAKPCGTINAQGRIALQPKKHAWAHQLPAKPFCRQASKTMTATALERLRLRWPGSIGRRRRWVSGKSAMTSGGRPLVSRACLFYGAAGA